MTFPLISIRIHQLRRQARDLGKIYLLIVVLMLAAVISLAFRLYNNAAHPDHAVYLSLGICMSVLFVHISRKDKYFVTNHVQHPSFNIFIEYALFASPLMIIGLLTRSWFHVPAMLIAFYGIASLSWSVKEKTKLASLSKIIPAVDFEWISGVRKSYWIMGGFIILAIATCWVKFAPLVFLWLFTATVASFYQECESLTILAASYNTAGQFLFMKIKRHGRMLLMIVAPLLFVNTLIHPDVIWINILFLISILILLIFAILLKYATYAPNEELRANSVWLSLAVIAVAIPFLFPLPLLMSIRNYGRAKSNLKNLFNTNNK